MEQVQCGRDGTIMVLVYNCKVQGIDTFHHRCTSCGGRADIQIHDGKARQVRLTGSPEEFRPNGIRPNSNQQLQIEAISYTRAPQHTIPLEVAYQAGAGAMQRPLPPNHPMHPARVRARALGHGG